MTSDGDPGAVEDLGAVARRRGLAATRVAPGGDVRARRRAG